MTATPHNPTKRNSMLPLEGLDKATVFAAFYNASDTSILGRRDSEYDARPMTTEEAGAILAEDPHRRFDYFRGRPLKLEFVGDNIEVSQHNRQHGPKAAEDILTLLHEGIAPTDVMNHIVLVPPVAAQEPQPHEVNSPEQ